MLFLREAKQKEKAQAAMEEELKASPSAPAAGEEGEEDEAKAAVVLQSNYRGFKERKKLRERHKTLSGEELAIPPPADAERDAGGQEPVIPEEEEEDDPPAVEEGKERVAAEGPLEEDDSDDGTEKAEDDEDDEEHTEVGEEIDVADVEDVADEGDAEKEDGERKGSEEGEVGAEEEEVHPEQEAKAATVLQSNFRGHRERKKLEEEGKIPARKQKGKSPPGEGGQSATERPAEAEKTEEEEKTEEAEKTEEEETPGVSVGGGEPGPVEEEAKAAVVLQSNFRGHKERKRLEEEGKIRKKKKKEKKEAASQDPPRVEAVREEEEEEGGPEPQEGAPADGQAEADEEKAATVLQSNFRGHRDRKRLRAGREGGDKTTRVEPVAEEPEGEREEEETLEVMDVQLDHKGESESQTDGDTFEEEQAAVKIQSQFRGHKDRKNLKASKASAQRAAEEVEDFSKEVNESKTTACSHLVFGERSSIDTCCFCRLLPDYEGFPGLREPPGEAKRDHPGPSVQSRQQRHVREGKRRQRLACQTAIR